MRCGKDLSTSWELLQKSRNPRECAVAKVFFVRQHLPHRVATRANALWQSPSTAAQNTPINRRNPRECAVAKGFGTNASATTLVATRANALWQSSEDALSITGETGRNPRECAVAKKPVNNTAPTAAESQHARMRCGKEAACFAALNFSLPLHFTFIQTAV